MGLRASTRNIVKSLSIDDVDGMIAGVALPTSNSRVCVDWIDLNAVAGTPGPLGGDQCGSRAPRRLGCEGLCSSEFFLTAYRSKPLAGLVWLAIDASLKWPRN